MSAKRNEDTIVNEDAEIGMLVEMGFSFQQAKDALEANNGDVDGAINTLLLFRQHDSAEASRPTADSSTVNLAAPNPRPALPPPPLRASRIPSSRPQVPGAVAVDGPNPSSGDDDYTITNQSMTAASTANLPSSPSNPTASEPVTVEARLVQGSEEDLDVLQEQLRQQQEQIGQQQEQIDHIRREQENIVVGQVLATGDEENPPAPTNREEQDVGSSEDNTSFTPKPLMVWLKSPRAKWILLGGFVVVIAAVVVGVVLGLPDDPDPPTQDPLMDLLSSISFDGGSALQTQATPQNKAYEWLKGDTNLDSYSNETKVQRYVLVTLYYSTSGNSWRNNHDWLSDSDECGWYNEGDFCSNGAIVELDLNYNNLYGTIPAELALLSSSVNEVHFGGNELTGTIPTEIGLMTKLDRLSLWNNTLTGSIPSEIAQMTSLDYLNLYNNAFSGDFTCPDFYRLVLHFVSRLGNARLEF